MTFHEQCALEAMKLWLGAGLDKSDGDCDDDDLDFTASAAWRMADAMEAERVKREPAEQGTVAESASCIHGWALGNCPQLGCRHYHPSAHPEAQLQREGAP